MCNTGLVLDKGGLLTEWRVGQPWLSVKEFDSTFTVWQEEVASYWHGIGFLEQAAHKSSWKSLSTCLKNDIYLCFNSFDASKLTLVKILGYIKNYL